MKHIVFALALVLGAVPVPAAAPTARFVGTVNSDMPPIRFQRFPVAAVVLFTDQAGVEEICGEAEAPARMIACHQREKGISYIVMPLPCPYGHVEHFAKIMCHELGHANGWTAQHEE